MNKLSFSFKKKEEKPDIKQSLSQFVSKDDDTKKEEKEFIVAICNNEIITENKPIEKKELVIELRESKRRKLLYKKRENQDLDKNEETESSDIKHENKDENELENELDDDLKKDDDIKKDDDLKKEFDLNKVKKEIEKVEESGKIDYEELARRELLRQATGDEDIKKESNLVIKPTVKNEIKNENHDKSDEEVEDTDYNAVKPEDFAMALMRGMTKNPEILKDTSFYQPRATTSRGVGLGFESQLRRDNLSKHKKLKGKRYLPGQDDDEDDFIKKTNPDEFVDDEIKINSLVCISEGKEKVGQYGKVVSIDEEVTRCGVMLSLSKEIVMLPIVLLRAVSKKEYDKESIVINKSKVVEYQSRAEDEKKSDRRPADNGRHERNENRNDKRSRTDDRRDRHEDSGRDRYEDSRRDKYESTKTDKESSSRRHRHEDDRIDKHEGIRSDKYESTRRDKHESTRRDKYDNKRDRYDKEDKYDKRRKYDDDYRRR